MRPAATDRSTRESTPRVCLPLISATLPNFLCAAARALVGRHAAIDVVLGLALEVIADVVVQRVEVTAALHAGRSTRVMARASVSHFVVSTSSCRRPLRVSR